ncbi:MAG TPA: low affinity iron permease family protein [Geomonas sp.]|nr:low affinity iron permease family protein [Geomonas sp.]
MAAPNNVSHFAHFASWTARATGHPSTFIAALILIVVWGCTGPAFHFSDTWQLVINTGTTIITFLMVFVIQNTQNRDSAAMQLKLDEIIRSMGKANNALLNMEEMDVKELEEIRKSYLELAENAGTALKKMKDAK